MTDVLSRPIGWVRERWPDAVTLLALALLCWVLAKWTWVVIAPTPPVIPPPAPAPIDLQAALDDILRAKLFSGQPASEPAPAPTARKDIQLAGVFAVAPQGRGWAVLQLEGKNQQVAANGTEIAPGVVLDQVFGEYVVVSRQGSRERLDLARRVTVAAAPQAAATLGLNVQQRGTGDYAFSRADLDRALREPGQLANLGALSVSAEGGVRIERAPAGSLAERLGLRPGDQIRSVNGQPIRSDDDLRRLYEQFNQTRQTAWVVFEGRRNDAPLRLRYTVQP